MTLKTKNIEEIIEDVKKQMGEALEKAKCFDLNTHISRLLFDEPFFSVLSRRITKIPTFAIPTAGVRVNPESFQFELAYNPLFLSQLPEKQVLGILIHEFYHIVFEHVTSRRNTEVDPKIWNVAMDLSINCLINRDMLPDGLCNPGEAPFGFTAEAYLKLLLDDPELCQQLTGGGEGEGGECDGNCQSGEGGEGEGGKCTCGAGKPNGKNGQFDSHKWDDAGEGAADAAKDRLKDMLGEASEKCDANSSWGTVSSQTAADIRKRLRGTVDWKKILRFFIGQSQRANKSGTVRKINKRFPYIHPGRKVNRVANIAVSVDQSGSVNNEMLAKFYAELDKFSSIATFTVVPFDHRVFEEKVYVWKKGQKKNPMRVLCGGTCFDAPTQYVNERPVFDGHIVLTDMCAPKPKPSRCQRMWMTTRYCRDNYAFQTNERIVVVEDPQ